MVRAFCLFCLFFVGQLRAIGIEVEPIDSLPFNNHSKIMLDDEKHIKKNGFIYLTASNFNLGMTPLFDAEMDHVAPNPRGSNVHCIINGEHHFTIYSNTRGVVPYQEDLSFFTVPMNIKIPKRVRVKMSHGPVVLFCALRSPYNTALKMHKAQEINRLTYLRNNDEKNRVIDEKITKPMVLYNEPTGNFKYGQPILCDFHLINCHLSPGGYHVVISVDGKEYQKAFEWQPFLIRNLPKGKHVISLRLEGRKGDEIENPFVEQKKEIRVK